MDKLKIDLSRIPQIEQRLLGETFLKATLEFYSDPENEARFQEWVREKYIKDET